MEKWVPRFMKPKDLKQIKLERARVRHIINSVISLQKKKMLKAAKENQAITYIEVPKNVGWISQQKLAKPEEKGMKFSDVLREKKLSFRNIIPSKAALQK